VAHAVLLRHERRQRRLVVDAAAVLLEAERERLQVVRATLARSATTAVESMPAERNAPTGTSATMW